MRLAVRLLLLVLLLSEPPLAAASSTTPPPSPPAVADEAAEHLLNLLNAERHRRGLVPLQRISDVAAAAQRRADEIVENFSHARPAGTLADLLEAVGQPSRAYGETLAVTQSVAAIAAAERAHELLMASDTHRRLLLSPDFEYVGVGTGRRGQRWYFVQILVT
jgi:uncharacterized protein YkwD